MLTKKNILYTLLVAAMLALILSIGPLNLFVHGFYTQAPQFTTSTPYQSLKTNALEQHFTPVQEHFKGVELLFSNISDTDTGAIDVQLKTAQGVLLESKTLVAENVNRNTWTPVIFRTTLHKGTEYILSLDAGRYSGNPAVFLVDAAPPLSSSENIYCQDAQGTALSKNLLMGYGYSKPTFAFSEKTMLIALLLCLLALLTVHLYGKSNPKLQKRTAKFAILALLCIMMTWNFTFSSFDSANTSFSTFQDDSESWVTGVIKAQDEQLPLTPYGLGRYEDLFGILTNSANFLGDTPPLLNDAEYMYGYSMLQPRIALPINDFSLKNLQKGGAILFADGTKNPITEVSTEGETLFVDVTSEKLLNSVAQGSLADIQVFLPDGTPVASGVLHPYLSSFGLQGEVFRHLSRVISYENVLPNLRFLCAWLTAVVLTFISFLVYKKYNALMSICFFATFLLSPWIVNFAKNLYWVEFTWFLPMLVGLLCACFIKSRAARIFCYFGAFATIFIKSLCGYEYLTTIMLSLISFLVIDFVVAVSQKRGATPNSLIGNKPENPCVIARTIVILGCAALAGFLAAICIHATLRGEGNLLTGIGNIIKEDALRRTTGGQISDFDPYLWESLNASTWETVNKYFHFNTEILTGISGNLFPLLALVPLVIFVSNYVKKKNNPAEIAAYFIFFAASISWFVLAKPHAYVHTHMNYVLWYFGFIQVCFYMILNQCKNWLKPTTPPLK